MIRHGILNECYKFLLRLGFRQCSDEAVELSGETLFPDLDTGSAQLSGIEPTVVAHRVKLGRDDERAGGNPGKSAASIGGTPGLSTLFR